MSKKKIAIRNVQRADMAAIQKLHAKQMERDGTSYPLPDLLRNSSILLALTFDSDGEAVGSVYFERPSQESAEMCFAGCNPRCTVTAKEEMQSVLYMLRSLGVKSLFCLVPESSPKPIVKALKEAGFKDKKLRYFAREVAE